MAKAVPHSRAFSSDDYRQLGGLAVLAVQFGVQPILSKTFITSGTLTSSLVLGAELFKIVSCSAILFAQGALNEVMASWTVQGCFIAAGLPSITYLIQNYCIQVAYQHLDGIVFNVLNQSKAIFTACFSFLIVGRRQSPLQCAALALVTVSGILVSMPEDKEGSSQTSNAKDDDKRWIGIVCVVVASILSGIGSASTEWALTRRDRNGFLLSIEIAVLGSLIAIMSLLLGLTSDAVACRQHGLLLNWNLWTLIPVVSQGCSGILVGYVTKMAGGVRKVLATICGLVLTCILQHFGVLVLGYGSTSASLSRTLVAVPLVAAGVYMHASFPPPKAARD